MVKWILLALWSLIPDMWFLVHVNIPPTTSPPSTCFVRNEKKNKGQNVFKVMENWPLWKIILVHAESALLITWRNLFAFKDYHNKNSGRSSRPRIKMNVPELIKVPKNSFTWLIFKLIAINLISLPSPKSPLTRPGRRRFLIAAFTCTATSSTV